ncbi:MAG: hypothetical protein CMC76_01210 [Flavobacteriaceae bacterium]|nr:hypothetical protein [Flavobacteriaceae bacterium]|tara:strand:+ start:767 stop:997 length:231 start_codon:yes stop_codon:yes gene_type:complete
MSLILILIGYFFDYKSSRSDFFSDLLAGLTFCLGLAVSGIIIMVLFNLTILHAIFCIGVELILIFVLKSLIDKTNK